MHANPVARVEPPVLIDPFTGVSLRERRKTDEQQAHESHVHETLNSRRSYAGPENKCQDRWRDFRAAVVPLANSCWCGFRLGDPTVHDLDNAVTVRCVGLRVSHLDDGCALVIELLEDLHDLFGLARMEVARG